MAEDVLKLKEENLIIESKVVHLFDDVREIWKDRNIIKRSLLLLKVDPSSACQRIFNAAIFDLKEKLILLGIDLIKTAVRIHKMEEINTTDDIKDYKTRNIIELSKNIGILSEVERSRMQRVYDIRNDLEHEDIVYEANESDVIYVFQTCIETVLSKDPIKVLRVSDIQKLIESKDRVYPEYSMVEDFKTTMGTNQLEIVEQLIGISLDERKDEVMIENAFNTLNAFGEHIQNDVKLSLIKKFDDKFINITKKSGTVFYAAGLFPYIDTKYRKNFFETLNNNLINIGFEWTKYPSHRGVLSIFLEIGYLNYCPKEIVYDIIKWMMRLYLGVTAVNSPYRNVYYSDVGASLVKQIFTNSFKVILSYKSKILEDEDIKKLIENDQNIKDRFDYLMTSLNEESKK